MGYVKKAQPVKLFVGILFSNHAIMEESSKILSEKFGKIDLESDIWPFSFTEYYTKEMGTSLLRKFLSFERLISPEQIAKVKLDTNDIESRYHNLNGQPARPVNLDPGYLSLSKVVLATTKDFSHRIYVSDGIYAEVTLRYRGKTFEPWEWTYPDYRTPNYLDFFENVRDIFKKQLRGGLLTEQIVQ